MDFFVTSNVVITVWKRQEENAMKQTENASMVAKQGGLDCSAMRLVARTAWIICATY